jgi:cytosine permease
MNADSDEFSTSPVPADRSIPWWKIAVTNILFSICLPTLIAGLDLGLAAPESHFLSGVVIGSLVLTVIGSLTSVVGCRTRLSSYMLARIAFGTHGSTLLNLAFAISLLGWFGMNINLFGDAMARLAAASWGYAGPVWPAELLAGVLMTVTTLVGLRAINLLAIIIVPILSVVCLMMLRVSLQAGSIGEILARAPATGASLGDVASAVVGGVIVGAVIMPDTCRFIAKPAGALWTSFLTYFVTGIAVTVIGGIAGLATGKLEILNLMLFMGLGAGAFIIVLGGSWILNALNLYSAALSIGVAVPRSRRTLTTVVAGLGGTLLAFLQILDHFLTFLFYLSIVFVPVASILIIDFFLLRPRAYLGDGVRHVKDIEPAALLAWGLGALVAVLGSAGFVRLTGIAAVDALLAAAVAYLAIRWRPLAAIPESV